MALPDRVKYVKGTEIVVADSLYSPTVVSLGTRTHDIDVKDLAAGAARQSVKTDLSKVRKTPATVYYPAAALRRFKCCGQFVEAKGSTTSPYAYNECARCGRIYWDD